MFIYSAKMNKRKLALILLGVAAAILTLVFVFTGDSGNAGDDAQAELKKMLKSCKLESNEDRLRLLTSLGWEVVMQPDESTEVRIPAEFSDVYERYNLIQKEQGLDLADYKGETVMRYTYLVVNHPSGEAHVRATLLVRDGRLVGGDICSARMNGFMHSLLMPAETVPAPDATSAAAAPVITQAVEPTVGVDESAFPTD